MPSMKFKPAMIIILGLFYLWPIVSQAFEFSKFHATYYLKREGSTVGKIERTLKQKNGHYYFESKTKTTGLVSLFYKNDIHEQSEWKLDNEQFMPLHYQYHRDKNGKQRNVKIDFDWSKQKIITHAENTKWAMPLTPGVYDKLLYEIVIMAQLQKGNPIEQFQIADGGLLKTYSFKHVGNETIQTPIGNYSSVKLTRHKSNSKKVITVWYAIDLNYLPVKVENIDSDGKKVTAIIKEITFE